MQRLQTILHEKYGNRNFALGLVYLSSSVYRDLPIEDLPPPRVECVRYFTWYHRKIACFPDLRAYVSDLPREAQIQFLAHINEVANGNEVLPVLTTLTKSPSNAVHRQVNVLKFEYMLQPWGVDNTDLLRKCWTVYIQGTQCPEAAEEKDLLPGDDALLLACYTLVKTYLKTSTSFLC